MRPVRLSVVGCLSVMRTVKALRNLTPHTISLVIPSGDVFTIEPSGAVARCQTVQTPTGELTGGGAGAPLVHVEYGEVTGLPAPAGGTLYIVSALVRSALPERLDLASPGDLVRDGLGNVIGCRNLVVNHG